MQAAAVMRTGRHKLSCEEPLCGVLAAHQGWPRHAGQAQSKAKGQASKAIVSSTDCLPLRLVCCQAKSCRANHRRSQKRQSFSSHGACQWHVGGRLVCNAQCRDGASEEASSNASCEESAGVHKRAQREPAPMHMSSARPQTIWKR